MDHRNIPHAVDRKSTPNCKYKLRKRSEPRHVIVDNDTGQGGEQEPRGLVDDNTYISVVFF